MTAGGAPRWSSTKLKRAEQLADVARLTRRGWQQSEIAKELGVSISTVSKHLARIRKRYAEEEAADRAVLIQEKLDQYNDVIREAWEAWERSKSKHVRTTQESIPNKEGKFRRIKVSVVKEERLPASEYLKTVLQALAAIRELLCLNPEIKTGPIVQIINWDALAQGLTGPAATDAIEAKIAAVLGQAKPAIETVEATQIKTEPLPTDNGEASHE